MKPDDPRDPLSPAGEQRRQAILADALRAADKRRRTRVAKRVTLSTASIGCAVLVFALVARERPTPDAVVTIPRPDPTTASAPPPPPSDSRRPPTPPLPASPPAVVVQVIREADVRPTWQVLTDDQFLAALADAGQPSGLARLNGRAVVIPIQ